MRNDSCNKCGMSDRYTKGEFSYCRPCHNEAQKRYLNRINGLDREIVKPPAYSLEQLMGMRNSFERSKTHCSKGHSFSGDNVRVSSQRRGKNAKRRCRACERNAKRVKYGLTPEPTPLSLSELLDSHE